MSIVLHTHQIATTALLKVGAEGMQIATAATAATVCAVEAAAAGAAISQQTQMGV